MITSCVGTHFVAMIDYPNIWIRELKKEPRKLICSKPENFEQTLINIAGPFGLSRRKVLEAVLPFKCGRLINHLIYLDELEIENL